MKSLAIYGSFWQFWQLLGILFYNFHNFWHYWNFWHCWQFLTVSDIFLQFDIFDFFDHFANIGQFLLFSQFLTILDKNQYKDINQDSPRDLWHLRHWLQFWQLRTWIHHNLCDLPFRSDTGQYLQFLRCLFVWSLNWANFISSWVNGEFWGSKVLDPIAHLYAYNHYY